MPVNLSHIHTVQLRWTPPICHSEGSKTNNICKNDKMQVWQTGKKLSPDSSLASPVFSFTKPVIQQIPTSWFSSLKTLRGKISGTPRWVFVNAMVAVALYKAATVQGSAAHPGWHVFRKEGCELITQSLIYQLLLGFLETLHHASVSSTISWSDGGAAW